MRTTPLFLSLAVVTSLIVSCSPVSTPTEVPSLSSSSASVLLSSSSSVRREATVKVFFMNKEKDLQGLECAVPYPVERSVEGRVDVGRAALEELLEGPSAQETAAGFFTSIPGGVTINRLVIQNGVASVEFDDALEQGVGGSCRVTSIRAQITETLKQFPSVRDVIIAVNGRTEEALQP